MKRRKLKKIAVPIMYGVSIMMLVGSVYCIEKIVNNHVFQNDSVEVEEDISDVSGESYSENVPTINDEPRISRPYTNGAVKIVKNFYDYQADNNSQEGSIIYYGNTYMQNSGVDYGMDSEFEVVSILDGTVTEVNDDEIMGKTVKVKHSNDLISVYQSMGNVDVKVNDVVSQGSILGKSGTSNVSSDLGNHLHFELYYQGSVVNPENYYDKLVGELG